MRAEMCRYSASVCLTDRRTNRRTPAWPTSVSTLSSHVQSLSYGTVPVKRPGDGENKGSFTSDALRCDVARHILRLDMLRYSRYIIDVRDRPRGTCDMWFVRMDAKIRGYCVFVMNRQPCTLTRKPKHRRAAAIPAACAYYYHCWCKRGVEGRT